MTIDHYFGKNFHKYREVARLPKVTDKEALKLLEVFDLRFAEGMQNHLKTLPSYEKYNKLKLIVAGESTNNIIVEPSYSLFQKLKNYIIKF